jgi:hypothetical protein
MSGAPLGEISYFLVRWNLAGLVFLFLFEACSVGIYVWLQVYIVLTIETLYHFDH